MEAPKLRKDAREIFNASLKAVDPTVAVKKHVGLDGEILRVGDRRYDLDKYAHLYVVGCGKAAASMAYALKDLLQDR
jgi:glycerate 2-kinase